MDGKHKSRNVHIGRETEEKGRGKVPKKEETAGNVHEMEIQRAYQRLVEGNKRFVEGKLAAQDVIRQRQETASGQKPYAAFAYCADSRVPIELIFDAGIGELFGAGRMAGNIVDSGVAGSFEYAYGHLGTRLLVVLGHSSCGAVNAACKTEKADGNVDYIVKRLQPAVKAGEKDPARVVRENVKLQIEQLRSLSPLLASAEKEGKLKIVGAIYDIESGKVDFLA
ncbi:MAG: carbonic anhydrase [Candidatus Micrarchaeota archaeon]|nr:carbonic anhydrase [Candidatus Micrarchaeota archaeon]